MDKFTASLTSAQQDAMGKRILQLVTQNAANASLVDPAFDEQRGRVEGRRLLHLLQPHVERSVSFGAVSVREVASDNEAAKKGRKRRPRKRRKKANEDAENDEKLAKVEAKSKAEKKSSVEKKENGVEKKKSKVEPKKKGTEKPEAKATTPKKNVAKATTPKKTEAKLEEKPEVLRMYSSAYLKSFASQAMELSDDLRAKLQIFPAIAKVNDISEDSNVEQKGEKQQEGGPVAKASDSQAMANIMAKLNASHQDNQTQLLTFGRGLRQHKAPVIDNQAIARRIEAEFKAKALAQAKAQEFIKPPMVAPESDQRSTKMAGAPSSHIPRAPLSLADDLPLFPGGRLFTWDPKRTQWVPKTAHN